MEPDDLRDFVERRWDRKEALKRRYWAERHRAEGPDSTLAVSDGLRGHLRDLRPDWPTAEDRAADLRHHLSLIAKLDRAAHAFSDR